MAARSATSTIPLVMVSVGDPVGLGFVTSLARPGGNTTGVTNISPELSGKLVELLVEIVPGMTHIGRERFQQSERDERAPRDTEKAIRALGFAARGSRCQGRGGFRECIHTTEHAGRQRRRAAPCPVPYRTCREDRGASAEDAAAYRV